jgi:hypothetical protein
VSSDVGSAAAACLVEKSTVVRTVLQGSIFGGTTMSGFVSASGPLQMTDSDLYWLTSREYGFLVSCLAGLPARSVSERSDRDRFLSYFGFEFGSSNNFDVLPPAIFGVLSAVPSVDGFWRLRPDWISSRFGVGSAAEAADRYAESSDEA